MPWGTLHALSEKMVSDAELAKRAGSASKAEEFYGYAAAFEKDALEDLLKETAEPKPRTVSILAVSATALYYKARQYGLLKEFADKVMAEQPLLDFARAQIQEMLDWSTKPDAA